MFSRLLIANRGEIACRIIQTAKRLGIETIAVYSEADQGARHVRQADHAIYIGSANPEHSYLNIDALIQAATDLQADALHPGYGFLSESAVLAERCIQANITFVGPSPEALTLMGSKQQAKHYLASQNVPLLPGYHGTDQSLQHLEQEAQRLGFPLLIKAANGGGGKGLRQITAAHELAEALQQAKREAKAYFGDEILILERFLPHARHVEVQVMGDDQGQIVTLFDRDCSLQRRHQKIIEEAPAPMLSDACRQSLHETARTIAHLMHYTNAGTIEFLVDVSTEQFYFIEMNTRLQVEHPVTEMITGLDLVEWQLRIANHEPLPLKQQQITCHGHAIECRLYAEDATQLNFPMSGPLQILQQPKGEGIRIDAGYDSGDSLPPNYDALIAKLITHGDSREQALYRMQQALKHYCIAGIPSNTSFLHFILHQPDFIKAHLTTNFLELHPFIPPTNPPLPVLQLLFAFDYLQAQPQDPILLATLGWQPNLSRYWDRTFLYQQQAYTGRFYAHSPDQCTLMIEGDSHSFSIQHTTEGLRLDDGIAPLTGLVCALSTTQWVCFYDGSNYLFQLPQHVASRARADNQHCAPMPGTLVALLKKPGDPVAPNDVVLVIEAMKMEHSIRAATSGRLETVLYQLGDTVKEGAVLFTIKEDHEPTPSDAHRS